MRTARILPLCIALGGCSLAPHLELPKIEVPAAYKGAKGWTSARPSENVDRGRWWEAFGDPFLNGLVAEVDANSPTLAEALARYDAALAAARIERSDLLPNVDITASSDRRRLSGGRALGPGDPYEVDQHVVSGTLVYEIDLWGRVRNSVKAGQAEAGAQAASLAAARLSLQAEVADTYFQLRGIDARRRLFARTIDAFQKAYDLTVVRHDGGIGNGTDVSRAKTLLSDARARGSGLTAQRAVLDNRIAAIVGKMPSTFSITETSGRNSLPAIPGTLPSELLQRRPDIAAAQNRLIAANARIGVARAAMYPSIGLNLSGGFQARGAPIISAPTSFWGLGPLSAITNLFDGGRRKAQVDVSRAEYDELAGQYRRTVLTAFQEVEDALANLSALAIQVTEQQASATAAARTQALALDRYRDGAADYLDVATAQTASLEVEQAAISSRVNQKRSTVALIRAIGGSIHPDLSFSKPR